MTLRITQIDGEEGTVLRVDGRLEQKSLGELEKACEGVASPLTLDLDGLLWIDEPAAETLARLRADGVGVTNLSPFVALRLKSATRQA